MMRTLKTMTKDRCCRCGHALGTYSMLMLGEGNPINKYKKDFWCCKDCYGEWKKKYPRKISEEEKRFVVPYSEVWIKYFNIFLENDKEVVCFT